MPLTENVSFKTVLQRGNRVQVPKLVRWRFKMDSEQVFLSEFVNDKCGFGEMKWRVFS
jgi:hypothetical protein